MKLHERNLQNRAGRAMAPILSRLILACGATRSVRKLIAFLNYSLGRGAGTGWELGPEVAVALECIRSENPVVFDVGANIGDWSAHYRTQTSKGRLFMFEPQPFCQNTISEKRIPNAELIKAAVGRQRGRLTLFSSSATDGSASLHKREDSVFQDRTYQPQEVDVICLDDFIAERGIAFVDFIKFDIEGHEFEALAGLKNSLANRKINAFSFEFGGGNLNSRTCFRDFWNLLSPNFDLFIITPSGKLDPVTDYYEDFEYYRSVSNFIAKLKRTTA
jgi:FkbM family methyltransferase